MKTTGKQDPAMIRLIEQQMKNWEFARRRQEVVTPEKRPVVADFVCISREVEARGSEIGYMLAERLCWPVFDKEILRVMAGDNAIREQIYASMDERDLNWCEEMLRSLMQPEFVKNDYFHRLSRTLLSLARQGSAVFIGRGADLILPRELGLRIRIVAPRLVRLKRIAERRRLTLPEAQKEIERLDEERAQFIRNHFHTDAHNPERYDLVINLNRMTATQAVNLIEFTRKMLASS